MALTDTVVRHARATGKDRTLTDGDGLALFVGAKGAKRWHFRFRWAGKQARISLGTYPEVSLKDARERRTQARAMIANGIDPRQHRRHVRNAVNFAAESTFEAAFRRWRDFKALSLETGRQSTLSQIDRIFKKDILPFLGKLSVFEIKRTDLVEVLRRIERRGALTTAEKCRTWLNQFFRHVMVDAGLETNPAADLDIVAMPQPPVTHNPFLRMGELPAFLKKLRNYGGDLNTQLGLRLLLLTGVRTGELRSAIPEQFDLEQGLWIIPPVVVKQLQIKLRKERRNIPPYVVPLSRQAIAIVRQLIDAKRPAQRHLLPHRSDLKERISENTLNSALKRMGYKDRLTGHGMRATLSTALNELGYRKEWVDAQLSHADPNQIRAAYNHAEYVEQRRHMMQDWADHLDRWEYDGQSATSGTRLNSRCSTARLAVIPDLASRGRSEHPFNRPANKVGGHSCCACDVVGKRVALEAYEVGIMNSNGRVTIPKFIRQTLGLKGSGKVAFEVRGGEVLVTRSDIRYEDEDPAIDAFLGLLEADIRAGRNLLRLLPRDLSEAMLANLSSAVNFGESIEGDVAPHRSPLRQ